ncbi:DUF4231 domain-containing protein [Anabaena cylindrica FACHB-243]|uniref:SMODS and SLOG-associating 2TM effector domain-containing protein n=1 Tax=Anabaena cylindrica (strain ATCC 27899 / PCC 7122) TaxID=272123 RepID=K9ZPI6_ANACC|nr:MULTISPECIES: SLATT domain-containing protein [Anabaena]AFZ60230.1 hypothetical protein Anacy_4887 [Anabaena cylindrica PCC 7122]MBD2417717.1 DUF4231 domain-containing protein [Anabaena cylindrica FACHB-243]MBY5281294.1 DUF4231 domain-containing protein [Anabaena sp. CCAP 1446/1C]MBY5306893.1 DUF4231 domain-containing protein [Anabaena sp. CCAP 1446/1C]MCM2404632.1 SLATT domain-containing protein [Anabaena sp. CCAP 1446/1C]
MQEKLQKFNVQISYSMQNADDISSEISDLVADYDGTLQELAFDGAEELIITLTFTNSKKLIPFITHCTQKLKLKITAIEKDEEIPRKIKFLEEKINKRIDSFKERRIHNREKAIRIKFISLAIASLTTILLGINGLNTSNKLIFQNIAFSLSAMTTFLTVWDTFLNHRGLWIRYTATLNELYELRDNLEYLCTDEMENIDKEKLDKLYQQYQIIFEETNKNWTELRKEQKSTGNS